ncbi:conserved hypothetical protein [Tenacibaculum ascidiaceicola]
MFIYIFSFPSAFLVKKQTLENQHFQGFKSGPTWARTMDPLIMSQVL